MANAGTLTIQREDHTVGNLVRMWVGCSLALHLPSSLTQWCGHDRAATCFACHAVPQAATPRQGSGVCRVPHSAPTRIPDGDQGGTGLALGCVKLGLIDLSPDLDRRQLSESCATPSFLCHACTPPTLHARRCKRVGRRRPFRQYKTRCRTWEMRCKTFDRSSSNRWRDSRDNLTFLMRVNKSPSRTFDF